LTLNEPEIIALLNRYEKESKAIKRDTYKLMWYMRGSITTDEAFMLSNADKEIINKIIEENLETTEKTKLPFF
jgi:hypothetical protein